MSTRPALLTPPLGMRVARIGARRHGNEVQRTRHVDRRVVETAELVAQSEIRDRLVRQILDADAVTQRVARRGLRGRVLAGGEIGRRLLEAQRRHIDRHGVRVLVVHDALGAVSHHAGVDEAGRIRVGAVEPLGRAGHVRESGAVLRIGVDQRAVRDHQTFAYADHRSGGQRVEREITCGAVIDERIVRALDQRAFARDRRHAVRGEDARAHDLRRRGAHPTRRAVGQTIDERHVERVDGSRVLHVDDEVAPLRRTQRRRAGLVDRDHRRARRRRELPDQARGVGDAAFARNELGYWIAGGVEKVHRQRVVHSVDVERRGRG